ncbi:uncharacterized protein BX663DRAFT_517334 [Cokeromyces recurvatus]|uniref:uncharacterized protein n=1 Tax=Cokeromyces recurvatus TaxID=90255 RepID=UPI00221FF020|nr:uncharacterized protein BX663DRAFT_517334 [Cokeromyces recurvatus]KAI7900703.1 hypothetical protein BX663DRAFT_517334 [Cokeromyces recurvatus]
MIVDPSSKNRLIIVHGVLMVFVWLFAVPFAVGINIYARKKGFAWGPKVHMIVMATFVLIPFTISSVIAFVISGELKLRPHSSIGTVLSFGIWIQVTLGVTNHLVFRYRLKNNCLPDKRPWNNHVHIWFGRGLLLLAAVNIPLGMRMKRVPLGMFIAYAIWMSILFITFICLIWMKEEKSLPKIKEINENVSEKAICIDINARKGRIDNNLNEVVSSPKKMKK